MELIACSNPTHINTAQRGYVSRGYEKWAGESSGSVFGRCPSQERATNTGIPPQAFLAAVMREQTSCKTTRENGRYFGKHNICTVFIFGDTCAQEKEATQAFATKGPLLAVLQTSTMQPEVILDPVVPTPTSTSGNPATRNKTTKTSQIRKLRRRTGIKMPHWSPPSGSGSVQNANKNWNNFVCYDSETKHV